MGKSDIGCLVVALVILVGVPSVLFLTGRGYIVQATVIAGVAGLFNAWLWFRARRFVAHAVYNSSLVEHRALGALSLLMVVSAVLGAIMTLNLCMALVGLGPIHPVIGDRAGELWLAVYLLGFFGWVGEGVRMAHGGPPVQ